MRLSLLSFLAVVSAVLSSTAFAVPGAFGPANGISPTVVDPKSAVSSFAATLSSSEEAPLLSPDGALYQSLKHQGNMTGRLGGDIIVHDSNTGSPPLPARVLESFAGLPQATTFPYNASIAVGPTQLVSIVNREWGVFDKTTGARLIYVPFSTFFSNLSPLPSDPKCYYDPAADRFILIAVQRHDPDAWLHLAVSQTGDATGLWYHYTFDTTVIGLQETGTFSDFPSLGCDEEEIYVGTDQYTFSLNFRYALIRCFSKAELYAGAPAHYVDFGEMKYRNGPSAFRVAAATNLSPSSVGHFMSVRWGGGTSVTTWTIAGAFPQLDMSGGTEIPVGRYAVPPDAVQPGTTSAIQTNDCRTQDVVWRAGRYHTAFNERQGKSSKSAISALRYLEVTDAGVAAKDVTYTADGIFLHYPAVTIDPAGNGVMAFTRSSASEFVGAYAANFGPGGAFAPSGQVRAGEGPYPFVRWGDCHGVANDPSDPTKIWLVSAYSRFFQNWATWIASIVPQNGGALAGRLGAAGTALDRSGMHLRSIPSRTGGTLAFGLPDRARVSLCVFDVRGRRVATLWNGDLPKGEHRAVFDGARVSSGVYFAVLRTAGAKRVARIAIVK